MCQKKTRNGPRPRRSCTNAALYAPPLMRAMSASCSALTRSSDSYSTCRRSSSRRRSRAAADFTAEARLRRSDSAAAWLRLPTARSFSRSVAAAFRVAFHRGFGRKRRAGTERASARETGGVDTRRATRRRNTRRRRAETGETTRLKGPPSLRREKTGFTKKKRRGVSFASATPAEDARRTCRSTASTTVATVSLSCATLSQKSRAVSASSCVRAYFSESSTRTRYAWGDAAEEEGERTR